MKQFLFNSIKYTLLITFTFVFFIYLSLPDVSHLVSHNPETTHFIEIRKNEALLQHRDFQVQWEWKPLQEISPFLIHTVIHLEDADFIQHRGFDFYRIKEGLKLLWGRGEIITGSSTITQQVAKNLYLSPEKTVSRKVKEILIACCMEYSLSKERILEIYLNTAEWGEGVFGAEAAAKHWFQKSAKALTPEEAARLALALPNPFLRKPTELPPYYNKYINYVILILAEKGIVSHFDIQEALLQ